MRTLEIDGKPVNLRKEDTIRFVWENPFLSEDRRLIPASMDFQLEPTPTNLQVFGNPNRLTSKPERCGEAGDLPFWANHVF